MTPLDSLPGRRWCALLAAVWALASLHALPAAATELADRPPLQIWFVRHAESEPSIATKGDAADDSGALTPLTKRGIEQALAFAETHASTPIIAIYTSTLPRAIQTSDALAFKHRVPLKLAPEAVEIELGLSPADPQFAALYQELRNKWFVEQDFEARLGNGESLADAQRRFLPFVREIMNRHALDSGVVIVMSHSGTLGFLLPALLTNVSAEFASRHPLTHMGVIKTELADNSLVCIEWLGIPSDRFEMAHP